MKKDESQLNSTSNDLERLVGALSVDQIRFVVARQQFSTDKEAAESLDISPATVKRWKYEGVPIDKAVHMLAAEGIIVAKEMRKRNLAKAMLVKVAGLDEDDTRLRQSVATEIIEWELGTATRKIAPTDPTGQKEYQGFTNEERIRRIEALLQMQELAEG